MTKIQCINKVELTGYVGNVRTSTIGEKKVSHFSLATNLAYKDKNGDAVIETTWHNCTAFEGKKVSAETIDSIEKGKALRLTGRIRSMRYTNAESIETLSSEVVVNELEVLNDE